MQRFKKTESFAWNELKQFSFSLVLREYPPFKFYIVGYNKPIIVQKQEFKNYKKLSIDIQLNPHKILLSHIKLLWNWFKKDKTHQYWGGIFLRLDNL